MLSVLGALFPLSWPRSGINIFNLLAVAGGFLLLTFVGVWGYRSFGLMGGVVGTAVANWSLVFLWLIIVAAATRRLGPSRDTPAA